MSGTADGAERLAILAEDRIFLSAAAQTALGVKAGDRLRLHAGTQPLEVQVAGDLPGSAENRRLAVMDIAAVQARFAKLGRLTRIDLRLAEGLAPEAARAAIATVPAGRGADRATAGRGEPGGQPVARLSGESDHAGGHCAPDRRLSGLLGAGPLGGAAAHRVRLPAGDRPGPSRPLRLAGGGGRPGGAGGGPGRRRPGPWPGLGDADRPRRRPGRRVFCRADAAAPVPARGHGPLCRAGGAGRRGRCLAAGAGGGHGLAGPGPEGRRRGRAARRARAPAAGARGAGGEPASDLDPAGERPAARRLSGRRLSAGGERHVAAGHRGRDRLAAAAARPGVGAPGRGPAGRRPRSCGGGSGRGADQRGAGGGHGDHGRVLPGVGR